MIASKPIFVLFAAAAAVSARAVPRATPPAGWWTEGMEDYDAYHTRYLALGCQNQHDTTFFDSCCHPLKKDETLETARPAECIPSASATASVTASPTVSDSAIPTSSVTASATPSPSAISNVATGDDSDDDTCEPEDGDDDDGDDDDDDDCEDDGDDDGSSSSVPSFTQSPESTSTVHSSSHASSHATSTPAATSAPAPSHTSSHKATSSTKSASEAKSTSSSSSSGETFTGGVATFFYQKGVAGACGTVHGDSELIAAIDEARYGNSGEKSDLCGKKVKITNTDNGKSVTVTIADDCPTCNNANSIDLSTGAFDKIADEETGEVPISWQFV